MAEDGAHFRVYLFQKARQHLSEENYELAFSHYLMALKLFHDLAYFVREEFVLCLSRLLNTIQEQNDEAKVRDIFRRAQAACNHSVSYWCILIEQSMRLNVQSEAVLLAQAALQQFPHSIQLEELWERVAYAAVERWHFKMLNDKQRNQTYHDAVMDTVLQHSCASVLDIGSGTGLLSLFALEAEPVQHLVSCEASPVMAEISKQCISDMVRKCHQSPCQTTFLEQHSTSISVPEQLNERVDLVVTEIFDAALLGEHCLDTLQHAWTCLLKNSEKHRGHVIPMRARVKVCAIQCEEVRRETLVHADRIPHLDLTTTQIFSTTAVSDDDPYTTEDLLFIRDSYKMLSPVQELMSVDFNEPDSFSSSNYMADFTLEITVGGVVDALAVWFDLYLTEDIVITTEPSATCCWEQAIYPVLEKYEERGSSQASFKTPSVAAGDQLRVRSSLKDGLLHLNLREVIRSNGFHNHVTDMPTTADWCSYTHGVALTSGNGTQSSMTGSASPVPVTPCSQGLLHHPQSASNSQLDGRDTGDVSQSLYNVCISGDHLESSEMRVNSAVSAVSNGCTDTAVGVHIDASTEAFASHHACQQVLLTDGEVRNKNPECLPLTIPVNQQLRFSDQKDTDSATSAQCIRRQSQNRQHSSSQTCITGIQRVTNHALPCEDVRRMNDLKSNQLYASALHSAREQLKDFGKVLDLACGFPYYGLLALKLGFNNASLCCGYKQTDINMKSVVESIAFHNIIDGSQWSWHHGPVVEEMEALLEGGQFSVIVTDFVDVNGTIRSDFPDSLPLLRNVGLKEGGITIPQAVDVFGILIESSPLLSMTRVTSDDNTLGHQIAQHVNKFQTRTCLDLDLHTLPHTELTDHFHVFQLDLQAGTQAASQKDTGNLLTYQLKELQVPIIKPGVAAAVVFYFQLTLAPGVCLSTLDPDTRWKQAAYMLNEETVRAGEEVVLTAQMLGSFIRFKLGVAGGWGEEVCSWCGEQVCVCGVVSANSSSSDDDTSSCSSTEEDD